MGDLKLFQIDNKGSAVELQGAALALERPLQALIEHNMGVLFGVHLVASEHSTGKKHGGRIDSLGLDENGSPVIFEYKRAVNENVINQGLFYLDWLLDHRAEFELLVMRKLGSAAGEQIDWSSPRLVYVASDFTRYDEHAIAQINRSIELVRYRDYDGAYLTLDLVASTSATATAAGAEDAPKPTRRSSEKTVTQLHEQAPDDLRNLYDALEAYLLSLGDDVTKTTRAALLRVPPDQELRLRRDPPADEKAARLSQDRPRQHHPGARLHTRRNEDRPLRDRQPRSRHRQSSGLRTCSAPDTDELPRELDATAIPCKRHP